MQDPEFVKKAFGRIADRYILTNHVLSGGTDILWRRKVARMVKKWAPESLLDLATGTGDLALEIRKKCPDTQITGADFCAPMLEVARKRGLDDLICADAMNLPFDDASYEAITVAFGLRNMANWPDALKEMRRVLKPGGNLLILDFSLPEGVLRKPYRWYLHHALPKMAGTLTGQKDAYQYLSNSIEKFPSGIDMCQLIGTVGFRNTEFHPLSFGIASIYTSQK